jgi:predicted flap endonuclease-1-like 5' DNA nuclease/predicted nuclease with TOPRIM domain
MLAELTYNMPVFSAVLLIVAGALVGYALTYPYRGETRNISRQLTELVDQNDDLHDELQRQRAAYDRLERTYKEQELEWTKFRASSESLKETLLSKNEQNDTVGINNLLGLRDLRDDSLRELVDIRTEKAELSLQLTNKEEQLNNANRNLAELRGELDELRKLQRGQYDASDKMADLIQQIENQREKFDNLQQEHTTVQQELENIQVEYEAVQQEYDSIHAEYASIAEEHQSLVTSFEEQQATDEAESNAQIELFREKLAALLERLQILDAEKDEAYQRWDVEHQQRLALDNMLRHKEHMIARLEEKSEKDDALREASETLKSEYDSLQMKVSELTAERTALTQLVEAREQQLLDASKDVEDHRRALDTIERHRNDATHSLTELQGSNDQLRADTEKYQQRLARIESELEERTRQLNKAIEEKQEVLVRLQDAEELWEDLVAEQTSTIPGERYENVVEQVKVLQETIDHQRGELQTQAQLLVNLTHERDDALTTAIKARETAGDVDRQREISITEIRTTEKQSRQRIQQVFETEKANLFAELQKVQAAAAESRREFEHQIAELDADKAELLVELEKAESALSQASEEFEQRIDSIRSEDQKAYDESMANITAELQAVQTTLRQQQDLMEQQAARVAELTEFEEASIATVNQLQADLSASEAQRSAVAEEVEFTQQAAAELQSRLQDQEHLIAKYEVELESKSEESEHFAALSDQLEAAHLVSAGLQEKLQQQVQIAAKFEADRETQLLDQQKLSALSEELEEAHRVTAQLQSELEEQNHRMKRLRMDGDEAISAAAAARDEREQFRANLANAHQETERAREQREEILEELRRSQELNLRLQSQIDEHQHQFAATTQQLNALKPLQADMASIQHRLESTIGQLNDVRRERDVAVEARARLEITVEDIRSELKKSNEAIVDLRNGQSGQTDELERELEKARTELAQFKPTVAELHKQLRQREERMAVYVEERTAEEVELRSQLAEARDRQAEHQQKISELQQRLDQGHEAVVNLERDRDEVLTRLRQQNSQLSQLSDNVEKDSMERDERRGMVYTSRPSHVDDLKLISGVAEVLEEKLNQYGIYTYEQIMHWDPVAVDEFSRLLTFRDRIERDDWIGQARTLHEEHNVSESRKSA